MMRPSMPTSKGPAATTGDRSIDSQHDDRADDGNDDAFDVDASGVLELQEHAGEPTANDRADDPQDDRADQSFAAAHEQVGEKAGDGAEHDPADDAHEFFLPFGPPRSGSIGLNGSRGLAAEDADDPDDDQLQDRPADEGHDGRDVKDGAARVERVRPEDPLERGHEDLAQVQDALHERVRLASVQQQQHDPQPDQDLDEPEDQDDDTTGELAAAWAAALDHGIAFIECHERNLPTSVRFKTSVGLGSHRRRGR